MAGVTRAYEYWPSSNRIKALHTSSLTGAIERSYTFDDEGRLTAETGPSAKTLTWDQKNRAKTTVAGSNSLSFAYDTANYRIGRSGGSLGSRDYYLEGEHLEAEYSGGAVQSQYFRGLTTDELVAGFSYDASGKWQPAIYHHDLLMSVTAISTHDGTTQQTASYSPFGDRLITATGASTNRLKYTGREQDSDTGLYYYRARYYDPAIGRFVSEDPLGFKGSGTNWYAYVANNPVNGNDPSGNNGIAIGGAAAGGAALSEGATAAQLLGPAAILLAPLALSGDTRQTPQVYLTYTRFNPSNGLVYSGRTSGSTEVPILSILARRAALQPLLNSEGFAPPVLDSYSLNYSAIRGREQQLIDFYGGARSVGGTSRNAINGISDYNPNRPYYISESIQEFGPLPDNSPSRFRLGQVTDATNLLQNQQNNYIEFSSSDFSYAAGGFLLYPNKSNSNLAPEVYRK